MQVINTHQFEQSVDSIYQYFIDAQLIEKKLIALGARNIEIVIQEKKDKTKVLISREVQIDLPGPLKKFAQPWNKVEQKETWTGHKGGPYYGKMKITTEGIPLSVSGEMKIIATPDGSAVAVMTDLNSNIPFLGKTITKFAAQASKEAVDEELLFIASNA